MLNEKMIQYGIEKCIHKAHFLSQIAHECDWFGTNEEYRNSDGSVPLIWSGYGGGSNYHGRGLIQITHVGNYSRYGDFVSDLQLKNHPEKIGENLLHTVESACWYWRKGSDWGDVNPMSECNDFLVVTLAVNGGYRHVREGNVLLLRIALIIGVDGCRYSADVKLKGYKFIDSRIYESSWYGLNSKRAAKVEEELSTI